MPETYQGETLSEEENRLRRVRCKCGLNKVIQEWELVDYIKCPNCGSEDMEVSSSF